MAKWSKLSKEEAYELFEDYKRSKMSGDAWAKTKGGDFKAIRRVFRKYFPHEYEGFIEPKMVVREKGYNE